MNLQLLLEMLTGQVAPMPSDAFARGESLLNGSGIGYSQMNELLLMVGYDRVSEAFFQFLVDGTASYKAGDAVTSLAQLDAGVARFREHALIRYGNFKYAFEHLSNLPGDELAIQLTLRVPIEDSAFYARHDPVQPIETIAGDETYYLLSVAQ